MFDITALGELLIDFTPYGTSEKGNMLFECNPGGAPCNVLAAVSRLGGNSAFIGMVGNDNFGEILKSAANKACINTDGLKSTDICGTTLAFVHLNDKGDRSFSFYRNPGADIMLTEDDVDFTIIEKSKIFHFGSLSLTHEGCREATVAAARFAKNHGLKISYDPNYRPLLWESENTAIKMMKLGLEFADIVKVSDEEMTLLTGETDFALGSDALRKMGAALVLVTAGDKGSYYRYDGGFGHMKGFSVTAVDTTACGDAFFGAVLHQLVNVDDISKIPITDMENIVNLANAAGAITALKKGAIDILPTKDEIVNFINSK